MGLGINLFNNSYTYSVFIEYKCLTYGTHSNLAVIILLSPGAEHLQNAVIRIRQQYKRQFIFLDKLHMRGNRISTNSHHTIILSKKTFIVVTQITSFCSTTRSIILGISIDYCLFPDKGIR